MSLLLSFAIAFLAIIGFAITAQVSVLLAFGIVLAAFFLIHKNATR